LPFEHQRDVLRQHRGRRRLADDDRADVVPARVIGVELKVPRGVGRLRDAEDRLSGKGKSPCAEMAFGENRERAGVVVRVRVSFQIDSAFRCGTTRRRIPFHAAATARARLYPTSQPLPRKRNSSVG
jgi:hypothetical protein